jgi:hypothetical protein
MRIALNAAGEVGRRAARILLAERDLEALGLYGHRGGTEDRRTMAITELTGFSVLVTDEPAAADALGFARIAADDGLSCVLAATPEVDADLGAAFRDSGKTLLIGADLASGIAETLAAHEAARIEGETGVTVAWTISGTPRRRGEAIPFPDPIGARWGTEVPGPAGDTVRRFEVPVEGPWGAAMAKVQTGRRRARVVGVADLGDHLAAIALAAGALVVAGGGLPPGVWRPADAATTFLGAALRVGMDVAAFTAG